MKDWSWHPFASAKTFTSYDVLFVISGVLRLLSVAAFLPFLAEPGARGAGETLRFIAANLRAAAAAVLAVPIGLLTAPNDAEPATTDAGLACGSNVQPAEA